MFCIVRRSADGAFIEVEVADPASRATLDVRACVMARFPDSIWEPGQTGVLIPASKAELLREYLDARGIRILNAESE